MAETIGEQFRAAYRTRRSKAKLDNLDMRTLLETGTSSGAAVTADGEIVSAPTAGSRTYLGDIVPSRPPAADSGGSSRYVVETDPATNEDGATGVAEGAAKPEQEWTWDLDEQKLRKIPAWVPVTDEIIEDVQGFDLLIRAGLTHRLRFREEAEIIAGTDTATSLLGVLNTPDVEAMSAAGTVSGVYEAIEHADGLPGAGPITVVVGTERYWEAAQTDPSIWRTLSEAGVSVVRTRALAADKIIAGPFSTGSAKRATPITLRSSDSHSDYFVKNKQAVVAEFRESFRLTMPYAFVVNTSSMS